MIKLPIFLEQINLTYICSSIDAMTFNGNSYVRYSLRDIKSKISSFAVSLRTTKPSGTIFSVKGDHDYLILEVISFCSW